MNILQFLKTNFSTFRCQDILDCTSLCQYYNTFFLHLCWSKNKLECFSCHIDFAKTYKQRPKHNQFSDLCILVQWYICNWTFVHTDLPCFKDSKMECDIYAASNLTISGIKMLHLKDFEGWVCHVVHRRDPPNEGWDTGVVELTQVCQIVGKRASSFKSSLLLRITI